MRCPDCGGSHSSRRGGEAYLGNSYNTWMNNCGNLFDNPTRADASWLSTGDYDIAFKGYSSHKTINIFLGGYSTPSLKSTLISGSVGLGIQALGIWAMGLFGRRRHATTVKQPQINPMASYRNSYFSNWRMPAWSSSSTPTPTPTSTSTSTRTSTQTASAPTDDSAKASQTTQTTDSPSTQATTATSSAKNKQNIPVKGNIIYTEYDSSETGYPTKFITADKPEAGNGNKANQYFYVLSNSPVLEGEQPKYKCVGAYIFTDNAQNHHFEEVIYTVKEGSFEKDDDNKYDITSSGITMEAVKDSKTCITNPGKFDYNARKPISYGKPFKGDYAPQYAGE